MIYTLYEFNHALMFPLRWGAHTTKAIYRHPLNPFAHTQAGRTFAAGAELFERMTRKFGKPQFGLDQTTIDGKPVKVTEEIVLSKPFANLIHFKRATRRKDPKLLIVAPLSGHFATLLRGTVQALLPHHDVYITDWLDAKMVPSEQGIFDLDHYIAYLQEFLEKLGPKSHVVGVCQPAVPVFAVVSLLAGQKSKYQPLSMTLMGGPIDPRVSKTKVTELAEQKDITWFRDNVVYQVPGLYPGAGREVYPGFIQLGGFMSMNLDRHISSHFKFYQHLVEGDGDSAQAHRKFYNEYLSVMDIDAGFYLQTVESVFQRHDLPKGDMIWKNPDTGEKYKIKPEDIRKTALLTIEGEKDDISALGQTTAAHGLARNLSARKQFTHLQLDVGHYGIFNGRRWREHIMPRLRHFIREFDSDVSAIPKKDLARIPDKKPENWDPEKHSLQAIKAYISSRNKQ